MSDARTAVSRLRASLAWRWGLAALLLGLLAASPAQAADTYGDIVIATAPAPQGDNLQGYSEYRFLVENRGSRPREVRIVVPGEGGYSGRGALTSVSRRLEVGPGASAVMSLAHPSHPMLAGAGASVFIDGVKQTGTIRLDLARSRWQGSSGHYPRRGRMMPAIGMAKSSGRSLGLTEVLVLHAPSLDEAFFKARAPVGFPPQGGGGKEGKPAPPPRPKGVFPGGPIAEPPPGFPGEDFPEPGPGGWHGGIGGRVDDSYLSGQVLRASAPPPSWSENWLAFTRYDGVVLRQSDVAELATTSPRTQAVLAALWRYAEAGGAVLVVGPGNIHLPATWRDMRRVGVFEAHAVGFGLCLHAREASSARWSESDWQTVASTFSQTSAPWQAERFLSDLHDRFPVVEKLNVPAASLFTLMLVFATVIGPLNLFVLTRMKRRIWLLWTVPVISFVTCMAVLLVMVLAEGWGGHCRLAGITLLDQVTERATTLGHSAYYSPLTPSDGLGYPEDAEVVPLGVDHPAHEGSCILEWGGDRGQHLARGWVTARVPAHFTIRRSEGRTQRRLNVFRGQDGSITVVNALGADISQLTLADEKGQMYAFGRIAAGAEAALKPAGMEAKGSRLTWRRIYTSTDWGMKDRMGLDSIESLLTPLTYLAEVDQSPFVEPGLRGASRRPSPSMVLGILAGLGVK